MARFRVTLLFVFINRASSKEQTSSIALMLPFACIGSIYYAAVDLFSSFLHTQVAIGQKMLPTDEIALYLNPY